MQLFSLCLRADPNVCVVDGRVRVLVRPSSAAAEGGLSQVSTFALGGKIFFGICLSDCLWWQTFPQADQIMASYTGQFVDAVEGDGAAMSVSICLLLVWNSSCEVYGERLPLV